MQVEFGMNTTQPAMTNEHLSRMALELRESVGPGLTGNDLAEAIVDG